jgi:hypothetical protein
MEAITVGGGRGYKGKLRFGGFPPVPKLVAWGVGGKFRDARREGGRYPAYKAK